MFWVPPPKGRLHPSGFECSGRQSRPSAKVFTCGENACTAHSRRGPEGPLGGSPIPFRDFKISILTAPSKTKGNCESSCLLFWVPAAEGGLHPSVFEYSGWQSHPCAKFFACGKNACTAHSRRRPDGRLKRRALGYGLGPPLRGGFTQP